MAPFQELLVWSLILSFVIALVYRLTIKQSAMLVVKQNIKIVNEKLSAARKSANKAEIDALTKELLSLNQQNLRLTMKPLFLSMIIFIVALGWFGNQFKTLAVTLPFALPWLGSSLNWFWWYLIITLPAMMVFRKLLGVV